ALIGPNGAGKTTLFNGITGIFPPTAGRIVFQGREITGAKPHQVAAFGIARTFQNIRLFEYMSSLDNVRLGQHCRMHAKLWDSLFKTPAEHREEQRVTDRAMELLQFVGIEQYTHIYARNLPYGSQRRLEIARALATNPALLLLDEPAAGFTPQEKVELMGLVHKIVDQGITVFLIEHDMKVVMGVSRRIVFDGQDISSVPAHDVVRVGIGHAPEGRRLFPRMIVFDNLMMGTYARKDRAGIPADISRVYELFPRLKERTKQLAGTLSGG